MVICNAKNVVVIIILKNIVNKNTTPIYNVVGSYRSNI